MGKRAPLGWGRPSPRPLESDPYLAEGASPVVGLQSKRLLPDWNLAFGTWNFSPRRTGRNSDGRCVNLRIHWYWCVTGICQCRMMAHSDTAVFMEYSRSPKSVAAQRGNETRAVRTIQVCSAAEVADSFHQSCAARSATRINGVPDFLSIHRSFET